MAEETQARNKAVMKMATRTVLAGVVIGTAIAFFSKSKPMGYVTNIVGFGIVGLIGGVVVSNVLINKAEAV